MYLSDALFLDMYMIHISKFQNISQGSPDAPMLLSHGSVHEKSVSYSAVVDLGLSHRDRVLSEI
jgi:hypothetical protein